MDELGPDRGSQLDVDVSGSDGTSVVVTLSGDLDLNTVGRVEAAVDPLLGQTKRVVVDVAELRFADSSALALWVRWANLVDHVEIQQPSDMLRRLIERMGLAGRLHLVP